MSDTDRVFTGSIPEVYDTHLVPLIFEQYAEDLAQRVSTVDPDAVLETAAGSGVVSSAVASVLACGTRLVASVLIAPMR